MNPISDTLNDLLTLSLLLVPKTILASVLSVFALMGAGFVGRLVKRLMKRRDADEELTLLMTRLAPWAVLISGCVAALQQIDCNLTVFLAGLGILGFAVGFAIQVDFKLYHWVDVRIIGIFEGQDAGLWVIKRTFENAQIEMPYPIQTVHLHRAVNAL